MPGGGFFCCCCVEKYIGHLLIRPPLVEGVSMRFLYLTGKASVSVSFLLVLILSTPALSAANEGPVWVYLLMAPFALFTTPFFLTIVFVVIAIICYWQYRTAGNKLLGTVTVLALLLAIPIAYRDKASFVAERESRQRAEQMSKERREARRVGKRVSPDFKAMSSAYAQKYQSSNKTEKDRLNFQAGREMVQMARTIDAMQQKGPLSPEPEAQREKSPPVRSGKTFLFELYSLILFATAGWAGVFVARWRTRRCLTTLVHIGPLCICLFMPVIAQLPFIVMFAGGTGESIYFSWLSMLGSTPLPFIIAYLLGILFYHWRARLGGEIPACQTSVQKEEQGDIRQVEPDKPAAPDEFVHFSCPGCSLAGRIATARVPEEGLFATCPKCKTGFPVKRDATISSSRSAKQPVDNCSNMPQELLLPEADSAGLAQPDEIDQPQGFKQYFSALATARSYFLLQTLAIALSWLLGQRDYSVPLIVTQLLVFALQAPLAFICVLVTRRSSGIVAPVIGGIFALTAAIEVYAVQVAANRLFPLKNLVTGSALRYALLAAGIGLTGVAAGWFFAAVERRYGSTPQALFKATLLRLRDSSFLIAGWCIFVLIEGLMSPHFHGEGGLIVLPIIAVVDNLPFLIVWLLARAASREEVPSSRLAAILFAVCYAILTVPLHSADMVFSPVGFFFQMTPFLGVGVMVCSLISLAWFRTRKTSGEAKLRGVSSLLPGGRYIFPMRNTILVAAVLAACYGSYNGSREHYDPVHLFVSHNYPELVFTDPAGKPLSHLPVSVELIGSGPISLLSIHSEEGRRFTLETDTKGILPLPACKPRLASLGVMGLFAGKRHIYLTVLDPHWQVPGSGLSPSYELRDVTARQTIACKSADVGESLKNGSHLIKLMPLKTWEDVVIAQENSAGALKNLTPPQLLDLASPCDRLISTTCDRIDAALLDHPKTPELIRKKSIDNFKLFASVRRSGNYAEPILAALEQDTGMSSWMELLRKEIRIETQIKNAVAKADGRTAAALHEEALDLHHLKKYAEAFALYQQVFTSPGPMLARYYANSSYACNDLGMPCWAMRLARKGLQLDPRHNRSADSYAQRESYFGNHEAAKIWAMVSIVNGFTDDYEYKLLGASSMETGDRLTAAACLWKPMKYGHNETWIMRYLERIGPRPFWQSITEL